MPARFSNIIGVDDAPFERGSSAPVPLVGAIFTRSRLDGVVTGAVEQDGDDASCGITAMIAPSPFYEHIQLVMIGGLTVGGFNVIDIQELSERLDRPVLVVARREPDLESIEKALSGPVPNGSAKWELIKKAGRMERCHDVWVQRAGLDAAQAGQVLTETTLYGKLPEPIRVAHLLAGGFARGVSTGRA